MDVRSRLRKKLAQKAWEGSLEKRKYDDEDSSCSSRKRRSRTGRRDEWTTDPKYQRQATLDEESIPYSPASLDDDEEYGGLELGKKEGYSALDYGMDDDDEEGEEPSFVSSSRREHEEDGFRGLGKPSEYRLYTTELGETFRVRPTARRQARSPSSVGDESMEYSPVGLSRNQHTIHMDRGEHPMLGKYPRRKLGFKTAITEDGYLDPADRDDPTKAPFGVEYIQELLRRKDILRSHPEYEFLSQFASHLSLLPEDIFIEESVTRKQAATSALLEAVTARKQARAVQLASLGKREERLDTDLMIKESELERITKDVTSDARILSNTRRLWTDFEREADNAIQANRFMQYIDVLRRMGPSTDTESDIADVTEDDLISRAEHYLSVLSPNASFDMTKTMVQHYNRYKNDADIGSNIRLALLLYSVVDFYASLGATFANRIFPGLVKVEEGSAVSGSAVTALPQIPRRRGLGWNAIDITILPQGVDSDDVLGRFGKRPDSTDELDQRASTLLARLFKPIADNEDYDHLTILQSIREGDYLRGPDDFIGTGTARGANIANQRNLLRDHYSRLSTLFATVDLFGSPSGDRFSMYEFIGDLERSAIQDETKFASERGETAVNIFNLLRSNRTIRTSIRALNLEEELQDIERAVSFAGGIDTAQERLIADFAKKWLDTFTRERNRLIREVQDIKQASAELQARLDILRRTGRGPGEAEIDVPYRTSLEWALKPINTGRIEIAPWALSAINAGHAAFKRYVARGNLTRWKNIERNTIQRDELMGPLFAEFCATFVNQAKIANPRRYMHVSARKDLMLRKASILKSMVTDLRYLPAKKKFTTRR